MSPPCRGRYFLVSGKKVPKEAGLRGATEKSAPLRIPRRLIGTLVGNSVGILPNNLKLTYSLRLPLSKGRFL